MKKIIGILICSFFFSGCAPKIRYMKYTEQTFAPTTHVEVLRAKPINRKFIELGEISIQLKKQYQENAVVYLKKRAQSIGADAIVILGETNQGAIGVPVAGMLVIVPIKYLNSIAIKYQ